MTYLNIKVRCLKVSESRFVLQSGPNFKARGSTACDWRDDQYVTVAHHPKPAGAESKSDQLLVSSNAILSCGDMFLSK